MTSMFAVPVAVPVNVADAAPSTKFALTPERLPTVGVVLINVAGNAGKPLSSTVKAGPAFRSLISAVMVDVSPTQIVLGSAIARSLRYVVGKIEPEALRISLAV